MTTDNPYAGLDISIPEVFRDSLENFVQRREGARATPLNQPFQRNVDIWFFALMLAVKKGLRPEYPNGKSYKAAEGVVLSSDSWRPTAMTLLAIAETGNPDVVERPNEMMRIATGFANAGFPLLFSMINSRGEDSPLDYLCEELEEMVD